MFPAAFGALPAPIFILYFGVGGVMGIILSPVVHYLSLMWFSMVIVVLMRLARRVPARQ